MSVVTTFDPSSLPYLSSFEFSAVIDWYFEASDALRKLYPHPEFPINILIAPEVEQAALALEHQETFPLRLEEAFQLLGKVTAPTSSAARAAILSRITIQKYSSSLGSSSIVAAVITYNRRFSEIAKLLKVIGRPAVNYFIKGLSGDLHRLVALDAQLSGIDDLKVIQENALQAASRIDAAQQDGIFRSTFSSERTPHRRDVPSTRTVRPSTRPANPATITGRTHIALAPLTAEERERLRAAGLCFRCRTGRHLKSECPGTPNSSRELSAPYAHTPTASPTAPYVAGATPYTSSAVPRATVPAPHPLRSSQNLNLRIPVPSTATPARTRSGRVTNPPSHFSPSTQAHQVTINPAVSTATQPVDESAATTAVQLHAVESNAMNGIWLNIKLSGNNRNNVQAKALLDTGANRSIINMSYLAELGFSPKVSDEVRVSLAGHPTEVSTLCAVLDVNILDGIPSRQITFVVTQAIPKEKFILLGLSDSHGLTLTLGPEPIIHWHNTVDVMDEIDPIDPPSPRFDRPHESSVEQPSVKIVADEVLTPVEVEELHSLVLQYADVFGALNDHPAKLMKFHITLKLDAQPFHTKVRYLSLAKKEFVKAELQMLQKNNIIQPSQSSYVSALRVVTKRSGAFRMCIDSTPLNAMTLRDHYPIPDQRDMMQFAAGKPYLATFDFTSGYFQIEVEETSRHLMAFITPFGVFEPLRLTFGVTNGPSHFQRAISNWLMDKTYCQPFIDDVVIAAQSFPEFHAALSDFLNLCRMDNVKLNAAKSVIGPRYLPLLGRLVSATDIKIDPSRLDAISNAAPPYDKATLHSFLGLAQWFSSFVPNLIDHTAILWPLLKKNVQFKWLAEHQASWKAVISAILQSSPLAHVVPGQPQCLQTDASTVGISGVLLQKQESDGSWKPLAFFSRKLSDAEHKYSTIELECLAIIFSLDRARSLIAGPLLIQTDHSNLQFMATSTNRRVQRWSIFMGEFDFTVVYVPGPSNFVADYLSRAFPQQHLEVSVHAVNDDDLPLILFKDHDLDVSAQIRDLPHSVSENGVITLKDPPPVQVVDRIFALIHAHPLAGHLGRERTLKRLASVITWPNIGNQIKDMVTSCPICQKLRSHGPHPQSLSSTMASYPFESVFIDFLGPLRRVDGYLHVLVMIDRFSHYLVLIPTKDTCADTVVHALFTCWICRFGIPKFLTSDGASAFSGKEMQDVSDKLNIQHHISAPYHPEGHGAVERANYSVMQIIRALFRGQFGSWPTLVYPAAFALNTAYSAILGTSPFAVTHGYTPRLLIDAAIGLVAPDSDVEPVTFASGLIQQSIKVISRVRVLQVQFFEKELIQYQKAAKGQTDFKIGDFVLVWYPRPEKLLLEWEGPYLISKRENDVIYEVTDLQGKSPMRIHVTRLHIFYPGNLTPDQLTAESARQEEFHIETVLAHEFRSDGLWFLVKWLGYDFRSSSDSDQWVFFDDCAGTPEIKDYILQHRLISH